MKFISEVKNFINEVNLSLHPLQLIIEEVDIDSLTTLFTTRIGVMMVRKRDAERERESSI